MGNLFCKTDDNGKNATAGNSDPDFHQLTEVICDWTDLSVCPQRGKLRTDRHIICSTKLASESDAARCINRLTAAQICHALFFTWWRRRPAVVCQHGNAGPTCAAWGQGFESHGDRPLVNQDSKGSDGSCPWLDWLVCLSPACETEDRRTYYM